MKDNNKRGAVNYEASQLELISDPEYMRIALTVTKTILILGLVLLPQPMEALVLPFSKLNLDNNRSFFDRRSAASGSTRSEPSLYVQDPPLVLKKTNLDHPIGTPIDEHSLEQKYKEDLRKLLLILNKPKFIHKLLWSYRRMPKGMYFANLG